MEYVVDLQGFRRSTNIFVLKEAAFAPVGEGSSPTVLLFKPPCKWSRLFEEERIVNRWLEQHFHGIPWNSGEIPYNHVVDVLQSCLKDVTKVYVKGLEKKKWIQEMVPKVDVCHIDDICCYTLRQLNEGNWMYCNHHTLCDNPVCAAKNVDVMKNWLLQYQRKTADEGYYDDYDDVDYIPPSQITA